MKIAFYIATSVFLLGLIYKVSTWFRFSLDSGPKAFRPADRLFAALRGVVLVLFSRRILTLVRAFVREVLFQERTWRESPLRGLMHSCIFWGFLFLFFMHALERFVPSALFKDYASTLNPYFFLRNLFGVLMAAGLVVSFYRRFILKVPRLVSNRMDKITMIMLSIIVASGFLLEASKMASYKAYRGMAEDYAGHHDEATLRSLEIYWVQNFGVVSPSLKGPFAPEDLGQGREVHEASCASCHSAPQWAFVSYGLSRVAGPAAKVIDRVRIPVILWYLHFLTCFVALALLPFSRLFHIFATPLSLLANAVMSHDKSDPANIMTRQIIELDACTHCGTCSTRCSVGIWTEEITNSSILPSEKMALLKAFVSGNSLSEVQFSTLQNGLCLCTNCSRCTDVCPAGIDLQELWFRSREAAFGRGLAELSLLSPLSYYRALRCEDLSPEGYDKPFSNVRETMDRVCKDFGKEGERIDVRTADKGFSRNLGLSEWGLGSSYCFTCTTCSSVCPVVRNSAEPPATLGLTPHQIILAANLGFSDPIFKSTMLWACTGCYQCQEACPQGVRVADVFYRLKNMAVERMGVKTIGSGS